MKDPAFLFYPADFLIGTYLMSYEDRGKYITILSIMHQQGRLSEKAITTLVGDFTDELRSKFKVDENGLLYNERLNEECEKRSKYTKGRLKNLGVHMGDHIENENRNINRERNIIPPPIELLKKYCKDRKNGIEPQIFLDFYESKGWLIGKTRMKDWQAAVRTWEQRNPVNIPGKVNLTQLSNERKNHIS
jgi:hypothetical protein